MTLWFDDWSTQPTENLSAAARYTVAIIASRDGVVPDSVTIKVAPVEGDETPYAVVIFEMEFGRPSRLTEPRVHDSEPIGLAYRSLRSIGVEGPTRVVCVRQNFPRDLPHMNPVSSDTPASPCVAWVSLGDFYHLAGIAGIIESIHQWFIDSRTGSLHKDGWHPVPNTEAELYPVSIDVARVQEIALAGNGQWTVGTLSTFENAAIIHSNETVTGNVPDLVKIETEISDHRSSGRGKWTVPWLLVSQPRDEICEEPFFDAFETLTDLDNALEAIGLSTLREGLAIVETARLNTRRGEPHRDRCIGIIVAVRRPQPLEAAWPGLSSDLEARRYEVRAFILDNIPAETQLAHANGKIKHASITPMPSAPILRHVSGVEKLGGAAVVGAGALGSAISEYLIRAGCEFLSVIDNDNLMPHNLARHVGRYGDLFLPKVNSIKRLSANLGQVLWDELTGITRDIGASDCEVKACFTNIMERTVEDARQLFVPANVIIDCTANPSVRSRLVEVANDTAQTCIRSEIFHAGQLGVLSVSARNASIDIQDLYYALIMLRSSDDGVKHWLNWEKAGGQGQHELLLGLGCASMTTQLPGYVIDAHASSFLPKIVSVLSNPEAIGSGIGVNRVDQAGHPLGWSWYDVSEFDVIEIPEFQWSVRWYPGVLQELRRLREELLPSETGGYLYGQWDYQLKRVTVLFGAPAPAGTSGTVSSLSLAGAEHDGVGRAFLRRCAGRIQLVGTWHSHPGSSATPSPMDIRTIAPMAIENDQKGIPTLMTIVADNDLSCVLSIKGD